VLQKALNFTLTGFLSEAKYGPMNILILLSLLVSPNSFSADEMIAYDREAKKCEKIVCIRKNINSLNDQILDLIAKRTAYVRQAGMIKGPKKQADDPDRVREELELIKNKSLSQGIPLEISLKVFQALIQSSIQYQQKYKDEYFKTENKETHSSMNRIPFTPIDPVILKRLSELEGNPNNLYQLLAHQPHLLAAWIEFAFSLRNQCTTSRKLRELMILRGAQIFPSTYEFSHHLRMAKEAKVPQEQLDSLDHWHESSIYSEQERASLEFMEAILIGNVSDTLSKKMLKLFTPSEYIELSLTASFYAMVPRVLNALQVPLEKTDHSEL
jgi:chorismate mutase/alkylhydroperoxidase family enzyme